MAALVSAGLGGIAVGAAVLARHRAQAAADVAVLAAAARLPAGAEAACRQARELAGAMHAQLQSCEVDQLDVLITVAVGTGLRIGGTAQAAARAGPTG